MYIDTELALGQRVAWQCTCIYLHLWHLADALYQSNLQGQSYYREASVVLGVLPKDSY